jgi:hypothetical protein
VPAEHTLAEEQGLSWELGPGARGGWGCLLLCLTSV